MRKKRIQIAPDAPEETLLDRLCWWLALAAVFLLPIVVSPTAFEPFRVPKELLLRAIAISIAALFAMRCVLHGMPVLRWRSDRVLALTGIVLLWTALTAIVARNRVLAAYSLLFAASAAVVFLAIYVFARVGDRWVTVVHAVLAAALLNAASCLLARAGSSGFLFVMMGNRSVGLLGNPNDTGIYLALAFVAAGAMAVSAGKRRSAYGVIAVIVAIALLTTQTMGAVVAVIGAALAMYWIASRRNAVITGAIVVLAGAIIVVGYAPLRARVGNFVHRAASGDADAVLAGRATPFLAAIRMTASRPLTGVGPGCFAFEYFPYKIAVEDDHPSLVFASARSMNFGDVHNDHLQILAQTGIPGYLLFLATLIILARCSVTTASPGDSARIRFARAAGLPLTIAFVLITLPEFVLELAAPAVTALALAAVCLIGRSDVAAD